MSVAPGSIVTWQAIQTELRRIRRIDGREVSTFLDVGSGSGYNAVQLGKCSMSGVGVEPSADSVELARLRASRAGLSDQVRFVAGNLDGVVRNCSHDLALLATVIEHVSDDVGLLRDVRRHLRVGGWVIVTVPAGPDRWTLEDDLVGHLRRYSRESLESAMKSAGFSRNLRIQSVGFPLLNVTERLRNAVLACQVARDTSGKRTLGEGTELERTRESGRWNRRWFNTFPSIIAVAVNPVSMFPAHLLSRLSGWSSFGPLLIASAQSSE